jgi:hypothetical protein
MIIPAERPAKWTSARTGSGDRVWRLAGYGGGLAFSAAAWAALLLWLAT